MSSWLFALPMWGCPLSPSQWLAALHCSPTVTRTLPRARHLSRQGPAAQNSGWQSQRQYETPHICPGALLQLTIPSKSPAATTTTTRASRYVRPQIPVGLGSRVAAGGCFALVGLLLFRYSGDGLTHVAQHIVTLRLVSAQRSERLTAFWLHPTLRRRRRMPSLPPAFFNT